MRLLLEGWEERVKAANKKRRLEEIAKRKGDRKPRPWKIGLLKHHTEEQCLAKFFRFVSKPNSSGCTAWMGNLQNRGYGVIRIAGKRLLAHRVAWIIENGPIKKEFFACHKCDNPACCNAGHIFVGTQLDNLKDACLKERMSKKLSLKDVMAIRSIGTSMSLTGIAKQFGVSKKNVWQIIHHKIWKHV